MMCQVLSVVFSGRPARRGAVPRSGPGRLGPGVPDPAIRAQPETPPAVATLAARRFGPTVGGLSGCIQATMAWSAIRGRLAEADILLACLVAWTMVALDSLRRDSARPPALPSPTRGAVVPKTHRRLAR